MSIVSIQRLAQIRNIRKQRKEKVLRSAREKKQEANLFYEKARLAVVDHLAQKNTRVDNLFDDYCDDSSSSDSLAKYRHSVNKIVCEGEKLVKNQNKAYQDKESSDEAFDNAIIELKKAEQSDLKIAATLEALNFECMLGKLRDGERDLDDLISAMDTHKRKNTQPNH